MSNLDLGLPIPGHQDEDDLPEVPISSGDVGPAVDANGAATDAGQAQVVVAETPDTHDLTHVVWMARCTFPPHGLLGTFESQELAERAKTSHLLVKHGRRD
jgi:hypothetical protein